MQPIVRQQVALDFKGLSINLTHPFTFDMIVQPTGGDPSQAVAGVIAMSEAKKQSLKLAKYFLSSLAIPKQDMWVNLSPYEKNRIIPPVLGQTVMGLDMLAQDYQLKQISAQLLNPETSSGKAFWQKARARARAIYGRDDVPINTFNKVWITPNKATVYQRLNKETLEAFIVDRHLKVMLEEDYLATIKNTMSSSSVSIGDSGKATNLASKTILKDIIIPILEEQVNNSQDFAILRQIYDAMILATWYKRQLKTTLLAKSYMNQNKVKGLEYSTSSERQSFSSPEQVYLGYLKSIKKGAFNFIKEDVNENGELIPRKYFAGGLNAPADDALIVVQDLSSTQQARMPTENIALRVAVGAQRDQAMALPSEDSDKSRKVDLKKIVSELLKSPEDRPTPEKVLGLIEQGFTFDEIKAIVEEIGGAPMDLPKTMTEVDHLAPYLVLEAEKVHELYGNDAIENILFAGRDAENLYDVYRILALKRGWKDNAKLFPGSLPFWIQPLMMHTYKDYFNIIGITPKALSEGKKYVIVDSGFIGTIQERVYYAFKEAFSLNLGKEDFDRFIDIKLVGSNNLSRFLIDFPTSTNRFSGENFPRHAHLNPAYRDSIKLANILQSMPRYHGRYVRYEVWPHFSLKFEVVSHFHTADQIENRNVITDTPENISLINPYAALLVQFRTVQRVLDIIKAKESTSIQPKMEVGEKLALDNGMTTTARMTREQIAKLNRLILEIISFLKVGRRKVTSDDREKLKKDYNEMKKILPKDLQSIIDEQYGHMFDVLSRGFPENNEQIHPMAILEAVTILLLEVTNSPLQESQEYVDLKANWQKLIDGYNSSYEVFNHQPEINEQYGPKREVFFGAMDTVMILMVALAYIVTEDQLTLLKRLSDNCYKIVDQQERLKMTALSLMMMGIHFSSSYNTEDAIDFKLVETDLEIMAAALKDGSVTEVQKRMLRLGLANLLRSYVENYWQPGAPIKYFENEFFQSLRKNGFTKSAIKEMLEELRGYELGDVNAQGERLSVRSTPKYQIGKFAYQYNSRFAGLGVFQGGSPSDILYDFFSSRSQQAITGFLGRFNAYKRNSYESLGRFNDWNDTLHIERFFSHAIQFYEEHFPDAAMKADQSFQAKPASGGIDLNEDQLDLKTEGQADVDWDKAMQSSVGSMEGFLPYIIRIEPYRNSLTPSLTSPN